MKVLASLLLLSFISNSVAEVTVTHLSNIYRAPKVSSALVGSAGYHHIRYPQFISVFANSIYFSQQGDSSLYHLNMNTESLKTFDSLATYLQGNIQCVTMRMDHGFYVCDEDGSRVLSFDHNGSLKQSFSSLGNLVRPVAVYQRESDSKVFIADGLFDHVVVFSPTGEALRVIGNRGEGVDEFMNVQDMVLYDDKLYVLDRLSSTVKVFSSSGLHIRSYDRAEVTMPVAIAVDRFQRIYVADEFDDTIKVYRNKELVEVVGGTGDRDGMFRRITDLVVVEDRLFVSDSNNNRIQVFVINIPDVVQ